MRKQDILKNRLIFPVVFILLFLTAGCSQDKRQEIPLKPVIVTEPVKHDSDDPAIWINRTDPRKSLVIGTDKHETEGGLYVFELSGQIDTARTVYNMQQPNNVDVEYNLYFKGDTIDIAVCTERNTDKIRIYQLPDMQAIDGGGISVFKGQEQRAPMGIALYRRPADGTIYAIVSRKSGPQISYLEQYILEDGGNGFVIGSLIRSFGAWSGKKEIEAIAVDDELGYVYYSDELTGIRKYHADPDTPDADKELVLFAVEDFKEDREGISIYKSGPGVGYILVSDQAAGQFHVFKREGSPSNPHEHPLLKVIQLSTRESDGSDVTHVNLGKSFPRGLFVAMSDNKTFQYYDWRDIEKEFQQANLKQINPAHGRNSTQIPGR